MPVSRKQLDSYVKAKAVNYHARAGQTIAGNLARGGNGQFASAGNASAGGGDKPAKASDGKKPSKVQELKTEQRDKRNADAAQAKADRQAKRDQDKQDIADAKAQEQEDNAAKISEDLLGSDLSEALSFALNDPQDVGPITAPLLIKQGLLKQEVDGSYSLTSHAKAFDRAARAGDPKKAKEALRQGRLQQQKREIVAQRMAERKARIAAKPKKKKKAVSVYKDAKGQWRWVTFSSSGYEDRDGETVSTKALQEDCDYCDSVGSYGDLLFWHEPSLKIGTCDFNAMQERVLVESGTFATEQIGEAFSKVSGGLEVSLGFKHWEQGPPVLPGRVFKAVRKFERSFLPAGIASNLLTKVFVSNQGNKEVDMEQKKASWLEKLIGKKAVEAIQEHADVVEKAAQDNGVGYKATTPEEPGVDEGTPAEETPEDEAVESDDIVAEIVAGIMTALQPLLDRLDAAGSTQTKETNLITVALKETATALKDVQATNKAAMQRITSLEGQIKALNGELPPVVSNRASQSAKTVTEPPAQFANKKENEAVDPYQAMAAQMMAQAGSIGGI